MRIHTAYYSNNPEFLKVVKIYFFEVFVFEILKVTVLLRLPVFSSI